MEMSPEDKVHYLEKLTRLKIGEENIQDFSLQFEKILSFVEKLNELDTEDVEPTSHILPLKNVMREDNPKPSWSKEKFLKASPQYDDNYITVPRIIKES